MDEMGVSGGLEEQLVGIATLRGEPISGSVELLPLCNMNCNMCYVRLDRSEVEKEGVIRTADEWLGLAEQMKKKGTLFLLLTGGEPLIYPGFERLYTELSRMGMILTLNTNGTMIDEKTADFFAASRPRRINITLYGASEETYSRLCHYPGGFEKTVRGIRLLRERNVDVKINGSLVRENMHEAKALVRLARELDAPINIDTYMYPATRERNRGFSYDSRMSHEEAARAKVEIMKEKLSKESFMKWRDDILGAENKEELSSDTLPGLRCRAAKSSFTINWKGIMTPCVMMPGPTADVFSMGFSAAWEYIKEECGRIVTSSKCHMCSMRDICQACAACSYLEEGVYDKAPSYLCEYNLSLREILNGTKM